MHLLQLFNSVLEKVIRNIETKQNGTIFKINRRYIAYADDVLILGRSVREAEEVGTQSKAAAISTGLVTNESKGKCTKIKTHTTNLEQDLIINEQALEGVQNFRYLGASRNSKNLISEETYVFILNDKYLGLQP